MDPTTLLVAGVAALAIVLIAVGVASSGGSGMSERLERYASGKSTDSPTEAASQGPISDLIAQSAALANLNKVVEQRDFGANLARDIARADLKLKPSEFLFIWAGSIIGIPVLMFIFSFFLPALGSPILLLVGGLDRVLPAAVVAGPPQERSTRGLQQAVA